MATRNLMFSNALENYVLGTGSLLAALNGGGTSKCAILLCNGTIPATADEAITGTVLCTVKNADAFVTWEADTTNRLVKKVPAETWSGIVGTATNQVLTFFRIVMDTSDIGSDVALSTEKRIQGTIDATPGIGDLYMSVPTVNTSDVKTIAAFTLSILP